MNINTRRVFLLQAVACGSACVALAAGAQTPAKVGEADPQAIALGYKSDASKVDTKKYPNHAATQNCANCALYQGKSKDPAAPCPLFAGKQVEAGAWCSAWAKKA